MNHLKKKQQQHWQASWHRRGCRESPEAQDWTRTVCLCIWSPRATAPQHPEPRSQTRILTAEPLCKSGTIISSSEFSLLTVFFSQTRAFKISTWHSKNSRLPCWTHEPSWPLECADSKLSSASTPHWVGFGVFLAELTAVAPAWLKTGQEQVCSQVQLEPWRLCCLFQRSSSAETGGRSSDTVFPWEILLLN